MSSGRKKNMSMKAAMIAAEKRRSARAGRPTPASIQRERRAELRAVFRDALAEEPHAGPDLSAACGSCGSVAHRWPHQVDQLTLDSKSKPPVHTRRRVSIHDEGQAPVTHELLLCGWCAAEIKWRSEGIVGLAKAIFGAAAGYKGTIGSYRAWLAIERPEAVTGEPWAHLNTASAAGHAKMALINGSIFRSRLVVTAEQAALIAAEFPGVRPHVWRDVPKPVLTSVTPTLSPEQKRRFERLQREHQDLLARKRARNDHDALNLKHTREIQAFVRKSGYDGSHALVGKAALKLDGLLAAHAKAHRDNGCKGPCTVGAHKLAPSRA